MDKWFLRVTYQDTISGKYISNTYDANLEKIKSRKDKITAEGFHNQMICENAAITLLSKLQDRNILCWTDDATERSYIVTPIRIQVN